MFRWKKLGRVFNPADVSSEDWMKEYAQAPSTLIFDDFVRVYFSTRPFPDSYGQYVSYSAYVDLDRNNLFQVLKVSKNPLLKLGTVGTFDEFGTYPSSVIRNGDEIRMYYGGWTRCESVPFNVAIGMAKSDLRGESFQKIGKGPVLSYSPAEPFVISGPKVRKYGDRWFLWYIAGRKWILVDNKAEPVYKIRMASSEDGFFWKRMNRDLIESRIESDEAQASPDVFFFKEKYHMFFCYRPSAHFRIGRNGYRIGYASSTDLETWVRDDSQAGIDISSTGWDSEAISYPHVFQLDKDVFMLYLGNQVGRSGFGLAKLEGIL